MAIQKPSGAAESLAADYLLDRKTRIYSMHRTQLDRYRAAVIVSVYKDLEALTCILIALSRQTYKNFEVIIAEDGADSEISNYVLALNLPAITIRHLTQEDKGFRKTRAVNRAVASTSADYLIFLDGDCIPHYQFVEMHLKSAELKRVCAGRRLHLGPKISCQVRKNPSYIASFQSWRNLFRVSLRLHLDSVRNFEIGSPSGLLHRVFKDKHLNIVGCNFSCFRTDFMSINGYDEELTGIGGEDCDLEWRFNYLGIHTKNVKYLAICYHLYHESRRENSEFNVQRSAQNKLVGKYFSQYGVRQHVPEFSRSSN